MATIAAPSKPVFDDTASVFRVLGTDITDAGESLTSVTFRPGDFAEAEALTRGVAEFVKIRRQRLALYAEGSDYIAQIVALSGEVYATSEKNRADLTGDLEGQIKGLLGRLQTVRDRLSKLPQGDGGTPSTP